MQQEEKQLEFSPFFQSVSHYKTYPQSHFFSFVFFERHVKCSSTFLLICAFESQSCLWGPPSDSRVPHPKIPSNQIRLKHRVERPEAWWEEAFPLFLRHLQYQEAAGGNSELVAEDEDH